MEEELSTQNLVAVHVGDVLELGLENLMATRVVRDLENVQRDAVHGRLTESIEAGDVRALIVNQLEYLGQLGVIVMLEFHVHGIGDASPAG